jgi:uncharacterized ion transporter superfamily protein YfcC
MVEQNEEEENPEEFKEKVRREREFLLEEKRAQEGLDFQRKREERKKRLWDWIILILVGLFMIFLVWFFL